MTKPTTPQEIYTNEFSGACSRHYNLRKLLIKREEKLKKMMENVPYYNYPAKASDMDAIINFHRRAEELHRRTEQTRADLLTSSQLIATIFKHFEIPAFNPIVGQIPDELEYEVWIDEDDAVYVIKTKELAPEVLNSNIMVIKLWNWADPDAIDDDLDEPKKEEPEDDLEPLTDEN